jgi:hypothetical protein
MEDKSGPALVGSQWPRKIIEQYEVWRKRTQPSFMQKGIFLQMKGRGPHPRFLWLKDGERIALKHYRRLLPSTLEKLNPDQLPEGLD